MKKVLKIITKKDCILAMGVAEHSIMMPYKFTWGVASKLKNSKKKKLQSEFRGQQRSYATSVAGNMAANPSKYTLRLARRCGTLNN